MLESTALASALTEKLNSQHLPIIRQTSVQIINLLSSPTSDIHKIARTILQDLAFTARVLTVANSAYYRRSVEKTTTVTQAILQVGYTTLRDIAIAAEFAELAQKVLPTTVNLRRLLAKAFVAAQQASALGQAIQLPDAEALFTSTLLESLGEFAMATAMPAVVLQIDALACRQGLSHDEAHLRTTGMTPHAITSLVAATYQLPEDLILAPPDWDQVFQWTPKDRGHAIVHLANACANNLFASETPHIAKTFTEIMEQMTTALALSPNSVKKLLGQAFDQAMELGVSVDLDRTCFSLEDTSPQENARQLLVRSCAQLAPR